MTSLLLKMTVGLLALITVTSSIDCNGEDLGEVDPSEETCESGSIACYRY